MTTCEQQQQQPYYYEPPPPPCQQASPSAAEYEYREQEDAAPEEYAPEYAYRAEEAVPEPSSSSSFEEVPEDRGDDSDYQVRGEESPLSSNSDYQVEDDSDGDGRRPKRRKKGKRVPAKPPKPVKPPPPPRPENAMTRKLRSAQPTAEEEEEMRLLQQQHLQLQGRGRSRSRAPGEPGDGAGGSGSGLGMSRGDEGQEPGYDGYAAGADHDSYSDSPSLAPPPPLPVVLERTVSPEQISSDLEHLNDMWETAAILDFLWTFRHQLQLQLDSLNLNAGSLMDALVTSPGPGLLASLHLQLLQGISSSKNLNLDTWQAFLANKLAGEWADPRARGRGPFRPPRGQEAEAYAGLPAPER